MKNKQILQWFKNNTSQLLSMTLMTFIMHQTTFAATFTVNSLSDSGSGGCTAGECTLREAITAAASAGASPVVDFQTGLTGTITLSSQLFLNFSDLDIIGPGPDKITISGDNNSRVFYIAIGATHVSISGLTIANGNLVDELGAGVYIQGNDAMLENLRIINNETSFIGGGVSISSASATIRNSEISGNSAARSSGISINGTEGDDVLLENLTISGNTANQSESGIGVLTNVGQNVVIRYLTVTENSGSNSAANFEGNGNIAVEASIIFNNSVSDEELFTWGNLTVNNSIIGTTSRPLVGSNNLLGTDPLLSNFDYYNGSQLKVYAIENGQSVAIDHVKGWIGDPQCDLLVTNDQIGQNRPFHHLCDAGAFESQGIPSTPPELNFIGNQNIEEQNTLSFTVTATDPDTDPADLAFTLSGPPAGASISLTGDFTFTPTEAQGPNSYTFTVRVSDDGFPMNTDFETITVTVNEHNQSPVLAAFKNQAVNELATLNFTATASDADIPTQNLSFSLSGEPLGASISPTGDFTFTPDESQGSNIYTFDIMVSDDGLPIRTDNETITITVNETNQNPVLSTLQNQTVNELTTLNFTATATDADIPTQSLSFSLSGEPLGASISPTGDFTFSPNESQGSNIYTFDILVTDDGLPIKTDSETVTITVNEVNQNPLLDTIQNQTVTELNTISFIATASDADLPAQNLSFSLSGEPLGASISSNGNFSFTPNQNQGPAVYTFDVTVTDDGTDFLSSSQSITITVENDDDLIFINGFE